MFGHHELSDAPTSLLSVSCSYFYAQTIGYSGAFNTLPHPSVLLKARELGLKEKYIRAHVYSDEAMDYRTHLLRGVPAVPGFGGVYI